MNAPKKVYVLKSGSLSNYDNKYHFTSYYYSSLKGAKLDMENSLKTNLATDIVREDSTENFKYINNLAWYQGEICRADYIGELGRYKGRIMICQFWLNQ